jgi:hypothetical protein
MVERDLATATLARKEFPLAIDSRHPPLLFQPAVRPSICDREQKGKPCNGDTDIPRSKVLALGAAEAVATLGARSLE